MLAARVAAEDDELATHSARSLLDRVLTPLNRLQLASASCARRDRRCGTTRSSCNTPALAGPAPYAVRLGELEVLSAARVADLLAPGQVLLRLAVAGFGVTLPPPG